MDMWSVSAPGNADAAFVLRLRESQCPRQGNHRNTALRDGGLHGNLQDTGHLLGMGHQFTVMTALGEEMLRVGFLEISASDFFAWNLRRNRQHWDATAMAVIESVYQVQVSRPATSGTHRQMPGQMSIRSRRERGGFLVSHGNPLDVIPRADRIGNAVQGVTGQSVNPLHPGCNQSVNEKISNSFLCHNRYLLIFEIIIISVLM
jgi:hypothetical protein